MSSRHFVWRRHSAVGVVTTQRRDVVRYVWATTMVAVAVITVVVTIVAAIVIAILTTFSSCARDGVMYAPSR